MFASTLDMLFRLIDMAAGDIANILARIDGSPYITQEVIWGAGEPIQPSEYVGNGKLKNRSYLARPSWTY